MIWVGGKNHADKSQLTNKVVIAQIVSASIAGDIVLAAAYAHALPHYELPRVLKMLEMDEEYQGNVESTGEDYSVEPAESRRPFRALLDVGLIRTTTGKAIVYLGYNHLKKLTCEERKAKLIERLNALDSAVGADEDDGE